MGKQPTTKTVATQEPIAAAVAAAPSWQEKIRTDLSTRKGLRNAHKTFSELYNRLLKCFNDHEDNVEIQSGIVAIWGKMTVDSILRDKLIQQGILKKIIPLLGNPDARIAVLRTLSTTTHHGGNEVRNEIARTLTSPLAILLSEAIDSQGESTPQDKRSEAVLVGQLCIVIITHSIAGVMGNEIAPDMSKFPQVHLPTVLRLVVGILRHPEATFMTFQHAMYLLSACAQHGSEAFHAYPPVIALITAGLRSKDMGIRMDSLTAHLRLGLANAVKESTQLDPHRLIQAVKKGLPDNVVDALMDYGMERCHMTAIIQSQSAFQKAMMQCAQDRNTDKLGYLLYELILKNEFAISQGIFADERGQPVDVGLPFGTQWIDALPYCAKQMRAKGTSNDLDAADVLDIKFYIIKRDFLKARDVAGRAMMRNPNKGFWYYTMSIGAEAAEGLRWSKKGLKCPDLPGSYVRLGLLFTAADHAVMLGLPKLETAQEGSKHWEEGMTLIHSCLTDSKTYVDEAPPDARSLRSVLLRLTVFTIAIQGSKLSPDLTEVRQYIAKQFLVDKITELFYDDVVDTQMRQCQQNILTHYKTAAESWAEPIQRFDSLSLNPDTVAHDLELSEKNPNRVDDLEAWLEAEFGDHDHDQDHAHDHGHDHGHAHSHGHGQKKDRMRLHPDMADHDLELYRCSYCANPSAALKKCAGCGMARYCDPACQKQHWKQSHKKVCKAGTAKA